MFLLRALSVSLLVFSEAAHADMDAAAAAANPNLPPEQTRILKEIAELQKHYSTPYPAMLSAARNYVAVKAKEKEIEATRAKRKGAWWDNVGISGGINRTRTNPHNTTATSTETDSTSLSASISLSLSTWFADQGIKLTEEIQRNAMRALQIQLALEAGNAHYSFTKSTNQYLILGTIGVSLENLKACAEAGSVPLSSENRALLGVQLTNVQLKLDTIEAQISSAQSTLKRLTGRTYPDVLPLYKALVAESFRSRREDPCKQSSDGSGSRFDPIPWDKLDTTFPIPGTMEESLRVARSSPALVTADLGTQMARNQWYLSVAGMAPVLSFNFSRGRSETAMGPTTITQASDTYTVSLGFSIRAGIGYQLRSAELLEEAARLNSRATELQLINSLEQAYLGLRSSRASVRLIEQSLRFTTLPALNSIAAVDDSNLKTVLPLFEGAIAQIDALVTGLNGYVMQRASILAQNGSLLKELERLSRGEAGAPRR